MIQKIRIFLIRKLVGKEMAVAFNLTIIGGTLYFEKQSGIVENCHFKDTDQAVKAKEENQ